MNIEKLKAALHQAVKGYGMSAHEDTYLEAITWLDSIPSPDPPDPYTCELMVGDVVEYKGSICVLYSTKNYFYLVHQLTGVLTGTGLRNKLKLTHRNGATIKGIT